MKLNSKLPVFIVVITFSTFAALSFANGDDDLTIKTIKGNKYELNNLAINYESYKYGRYLIKNNRLSKDGITKDTKLSRNYIDEHGKRKTLIDISSGSDNISQVGYSYEFEETTDTKNIKFIYSKDNGHKDKLILPTQGKDEEIDKDNLKKIEDNLNEIDVNINKNESALNMDIKPLASLRYKDEIYILSNYFAEYSYRNKIQISKLNVSENKLEIIKDINLIDEIGTKYGETLISVVNSNKYDNKFYSLIEVKEGDSLSKLRLGKVYIFTYDLEKNDYEIEEVLNNQNGYSCEDVVYSKFENSNLELVLSDINKDVKISDIKYDLSDKKVISKKDTILEKNIDTEARRYIKASAVDKYRIYIDIVNEFYFSLDEKNKLYVIDRNNNNISYEGKIIHNPKDRIIQFKEVGS